MFEHPGNLGPAHGTLLTVYHADWPAYADGDDVRFSLLESAVAPALLDSSKTQERDFGTH